MFERKYVFIPTRVLEGTPADVGLQYSDVRFAAADGVRLHGWLIPGSGDLVWLFFHGNKGNMSHYRTYLRALHDGLWASIFVFDYRGYGESEGHPSEKGLYQDAEAALRWVRAQPGLAEKPVVYAGHSLGTAIAIDLALRHEPSAVVLEAPLLSVPAITWDRARWALPLSYLLLRARFNAARKIGRVRSPVFIAHGELDDTVPFRHGRRLFDLAKEPKTFYPITGGGHRDPYLEGGPAYMEALKRFIQAWTAKAMPEAAGSAL